ncbi:MAG: S-layer homology domain-containing protein [Oscillospiraceae bacterium]|jgi:hypothetical protein|nr:S-layer homology domain-containing protein [Oscillospiraceae bacterium]
MKKLTKLTVFILVFAMIAGMSSAFAAFSVPTSPLNTNDGVIKVIAARAGQIAPLILGADLVASTNLGASDGSFTGANAILGVFGSNINAKPDPWLYNYFYNLGQPAANKVFNATISEHQEDGTPAGDPTITEELTHKPNLILTQAEGVGDPSPTRFASYVNIINALPENTDGDLTNDYAPSFFTCSTSSLVVQCQNLIALANAINTVAGEKNLKTRYGNPYDTAANYDKYVWGYFFYVQEQLDSGALTKKSSAVLSGTSDSGANWNLAARTAGTGRPTSRLVEYVQDNTVLLNETVGANTATLAQVLACDVVIATGNNGNALRAAAATAGVPEADLPFIIDTLPTCLYGMIMQTHENALGIPLIQSMIYGDELGINPVYAAAYFYQNFFHITDNSALQETVTTLMASATLPTGVTTSLAQYDPQSVEAIIAAGVTYGTGKTRHADATPWAPDTSVPLGAGKDANPTVVYPPYVPVVNPKEEAIADEETPLTETPEPEDAFSDISAEDWYYEAVKYVREQGLMTGTSGSEFSPKLKLSRAMTATVIYRLAGEPAVTGENSFGDVKDGQWYTDPITWAAVSGIVGGYSDKQFGTLDDVTREQIVTILYRYAVLKGKDTTARAELDKFPDAGDLSSWAEDAMSWAVAIGLIDGRDGALAAKDGTTRAEFATLIMRYIEIVGK